MGDDHPEALFDRTDDGRWIPTEWSRGPWDPAHCHGGPVAALLAREIERHEPGDVEWQLARITIELTRPVPVGRPLSLTTSMERPGKRVGLVAAFLLDDDIEVARVRGLRIRREHAVADDDRASVEAIAASHAGFDGDERFPAPPQAGRAERPTFLGDDDGVSFASTACEHRFVEGSWADPGPVAVWIRLTVPVVVGEAPSSTQRTAAAADFGNGVSHVLPWDHYLFINPDLTVHLARPAAGEWIGIRSITRIGAEGAGLAESALFDESGRIGRSLQSLFVTPR
ncbi:MAG: thioesterase family protein [Ilumatobacteraceae bacterium]